MMGTCLLMMLGFVTMGSVAGLVGRQQPRSSRGLRLAPARVGDRREGVVRSLFAFAGRAESARTTMRRGERSDLEAIVALSYAEFSPQYASPIDRAALKVLLWIGFYIRLTYPEPLDHAVWLVSDDELLGMVELSLQPECAGARVAPAVPPPQWLKRASSSNGDLRPYLSNLLVAKAARRRGLGATLVAQCERAAAEWGFDDLALHFDRDDATLLGFYRRQGYGDPDAGARTIAVDGYTLLFVTKPVRSRS